MNLSNIGHKGYDETVLDPNFPPGSAFWKHASFSKAVEVFPMLRRAVESFPQDLGIEMFSGQRQIESFWSSYKNHGYGYLLYSLVKELQPEQCVEIGVLQGFSLLTIAAALRDNNRGQVIGYDLFENYPFHHDTYANVESRIEALKLQSFASIKFGDVLSVDQQFEAVDFLHVDISNDGDTYRDTFDRWHNKVRSIIVLEGGGHARDRCEWMVKYKRPSINERIQTLKKSYPEWLILVFEPFPSLTLAIRQH